MKILFKLNLLLLFVYSINAFSQGQSWNWYFGATAGVTFPGGGAPVAVTNGQINTIEGVAAMSDAAGNLLFYTDGSTVWNKLHLVMANGTGLLGNGSSTQSGVIVPKPGSPNIYYVFTVGIFNQGLRYSEIDMNLAAGNGSVTVKNTFLWQNNTEKCCAVRHCNNTDVWVITHDATTNNFRTYLVTATGVNPVPIVQAIGAANPNPGIGYLKTSFDGKKIAYATYTNGFIEIFDFNNSNAAISNPINITAGNYNGCYGVEFSADNTKLYFGNFSTKTIWQFNLCAGSNAAIIASGTQVGTSLGNVGALQMGPDGKIWVARYPNPWLGVINNPNALGMACNYVDNGVSLNGKNSQAGLPNFIASYFNPPPPPFTTTINCLNVNFASPTVNVSNCGGAANAITSYAWNFGDPASGINNTSAIANPNHAFTIGGTYTVQLTLGYACGSATLTQTVSVISCSPTVIINTPTLCSGSCAAITATASGGTPPYTYNWTPNIGSTAGPFNVCPNTTTIYTVSITDANNVVATGTTAVQVTPSPTVNIVTSSPTLCLNNYNGSVNTVTVNASGATNYLWTGITGLTTNTTTGSVINTTAMIGSSIGTGSVTGSNGSCSTTVTFSVTKLPNPIVTVNSATICNGASATLTANGAISYAWSPPTALSSTTGSSVVSNPNQTVVYSVIGNSLNCFSASQNATVTVPATPVTVGIASNANQACMGNNINFIANAGGGLGAPFTYSWSNNSSGAAISVNEPQYGIYTYTVVASDVFSCKASAIKTVTFIPNPILTSVGKDVCAGKSANLYVNGASSYTWSPAFGLNTTTGAAVIATPSVTTVYTILGNNSICTGATTVAVNVVQYPNTELTSTNQQICKGKNTQIISNGAQFNNWAPNYAISSTSGNAVTVWPQVNTTYTITSYNASGTVVCAITKQMPIIVVPQATAVVSNNQSICKGNKVTLSAMGGNTFSWSPNQDLNHANSSAVIATPTANTIYTVNVSHNGFCDNSATVSVIVNPNPTVFAGRDSVYNLDEPMYLNATGTGTLTWTAGEGILCSVCPNTVIKPTRSGCYFIETVNEFGCKAKDDVCIEVTLNSGIYVPNTFTPNGDGLNDVFFVYGYSVTDINLDIFDRWGERLFTSTDQKNGWDGTYKGVKCKSDSYVYKITYKGLDGKTQLKTGQITITN